MSRPAPAAAAILLATVLALTACSGGTPRSPKTPAPTPTQKPAASAVYRFGVVGNRGKIASLERGTPTVVKGITGTVVQIATSNSDGYALTSAGTVWAWGVGSYGELGDGTTSAYVTRAVQVSFPAGVKIVALPNPMPFDAALAIDADGHAWGWGLNADGDLCLSALIQRRPSRIPLTDVTAATGARTHSLFDSGGRVYACGSGQDGVLGTGSTASSATPVPVKDLPEAGTRVTALTSSWAGSGALLSNGAYYDWGYNAAGQLGDGRTGRNTDSDVPVRVALPAAVRQVSQGGSGAGNGQTVAILADGSVWAWGDGTKGQLGDGRTGRTADSDVPVRVRTPAGVTFTKVNSGGYSCYAIDEEGRLWAWGGNQNGQLGTGTSKRVETEPVNVGIDLTQVSSTASNVAGFEQS